jgi:hypothetical protein
MSFHPPYRGTGQYHLEAHPPPEPIHMCRRTWPNLMRTPQALWCWRFGKIGLPQNAKLLLGWYSKIVCGLRTVLSVVGGKTPVLVNFANGKQKRWRIYCSNVDIFFEFGGALRIGLGLRILTLHLGQTLTPLRNGGVLSPEPMVGVGKV